MLVLDEPTDGLDECNTDVVADVLRSFAGAGKTVLFSTTTTSLSGSSSASSTYTPPTKRRGRWHSLCATALRVAVEDGLRATVFLARRLACTRLRFPLSAVRLVPSAVACCGFNGVRKKKRMRRTTKAPVGAKAARSGKKWSPGLCMARRGYQYIPGLPCYAVRVLRRLSPVCRDATAALRGGNPWTWR